MFMYLSNRHKSTIFFCVHLCVQTMCVKNSTLLVGTLMTQLHKCIMQHTHNAAHTECSTHTSKHSSTYQYQVWTGVCWCSCVCVCVCVCERERERVHAYYRIKRVQLHVCKLTWYYGLDLLLGRAPPVFWSFMKSACISTRAYIHGKKWWFIHCFHLLHTCFHYVQTLCKRRRVNRTSFFSRRLVFLVVTVAICVVLLLWLLRIFKLNTVWILTGFLIK